MRCTKPGDAAQLEKKESANGPSTLNEDQSAERGARMARRDDREYREYLREEQRSQPGCPAREMVLDQRGRATSGPYRLLANQPRTHGMTNYAFCVVHATVK